MSYREAEGIAPHEIAGARDGVVEAIEAVLAAR